MTIGTVVCLYWYRSVRSFAKGYAKRKEVIALLGEICLAIFSIGFFRMAFCQFVKRFHINNSSRLFRWQKELLFHLYLFPILCELCMYIENFASFARDSVMRLNGSCREILFRKTCFFIIQGKTFGLTGRFISFLLKESGNTLLQLQLLPHLKKKKIRFTSRVFVQLYK